MKRKSVIALIAVAVMSLLLSSVAFAGTEARKDKSDEPIIEFTHRYMDLHLTMKLSRLGSFNKLLPNSLRREIGDEYYPEIRRRLTTGDSMTFKEGSASIERYPNDKIKLTLTFPNFYLTISNATWEQVDAFFEKYF